MGTRKKRERQESLWYGGELPTAPGHPFYSRLNGVLEKAEFDRFCEKNCAGFYHAKLGRPSLAPGLYFRIMMIGFFEGIDSERGIAWRLADSLRLRQFLSRTRREDAGSRDDIAHAAVDRPELISGSSLGAGAVGASRAD